MNRFEFFRPATLDSALALTAPSPQPQPDEEGGVVWLAGGQSLLAAMKLGMATPSALVDLQDVPGLRDIRLEPGADGQTALWIGAMATHASVAASDVVRRFSPGLAALAGNIADAQVRNMGTLGGALAHNDPAACWPAGVLAAGASIVTQRRTIAADAYFQGLYSTALTAGELILGVRFPPSSGLHYIKFEQPASRFALTGVAVARSAQPDHAVRVAVTGLGFGVVRWDQAEQALMANFDFTALDALTPLHASNVSVGLEALGDMHATAAYRCHLAHVLLRRCVAEISGRPLPPRAPLTPLTRAAAQPQAGAQALTERGQPSEPAPPVPAAPAAREGFGGCQHLAAPAAQVWQAILDPAHLQTSIPGCESLVQRSAQAYEATVKVGLGPLSVRFKSEVTLSDLRPPESLTLGFVGQAGALGSGQGTAQVRFEPTADGGTDLHWWVQVQLSGRLAQFGNRLVEASARKLSAEFFQRFSAVLHPGDGQTLPGGQQLAGSWRAMGARLKSFVQRLLSFTRK
ncbi:MAG: FAD binding domain-containing protein [Pseudomonadota bacterium]|jgi:carbon-monoxide dehydrogenase medium subunit